MSRDCPRAGCDNRLSAQQIICAGDFAALAGMCRGKKPLGQPEADMIEGRGRGLAYCCPLCLMWHNGHQPARLMEPQVALATVAALRADPRVGWQGILQLVDAWRVTPRAGWAEGLDQSVAIHVLSV